MARLVDASAGSGDLPPGMWFYVFMFGDQRLLVSEHVAAGRLPLPSSLLIGLGVGAALTVLRLLLDFAFFMVSQLIGRWTAGAFRGADDGIPVIATNTAK